MLKSEITVLERQRACVKRRRHHASDCRPLSPVTTRASRVKDFQDLVASGGRPELANYEIPPTYPCVSITPAETSLIAAGENPNKKRKAKKELKSNVGDVQSEAGKGKEKRIKPISKEEEEESKITEQTETWKQNSKASQEVEKSGYIHVRARRGQATDSHSLAERVRREKISERMKYLQNLVPGCDKITGKAGMLDEIINYVQSLQQQVEFLSMKLAAQNPRLDFINLDHLFAKQVYPTTEISPETANSSSYFDQLGIGSSSVTVSQTPFIHSPSFPNFELSSTWGNDLQSLYSMSFEPGGPPLLSPSSFQSQQFSGIEDEEKFVPF